MIVKFVQLIVLALNYVPGSVNKEYDGKQIYGNLFSHKLYSMREIESDNYNNV